jgi:hypothetical protein
MSRRDHDDDDDSDVQRPKRRSKHDDDDDDFEEEQPKRKVKHNDDSTRSGERKKHRSHDDEERPKKKKRKQQKSNKGVIIGVSTAAGLLLVGAIVAFVMIGNRPSKVEGIGDPVDQLKEANLSYDNLKRIGIGMMNFNDATNFFPNDIYNSKGEPILSWRVAILPYIDESALYREFKLNEPWDSPMNKQLLARMPSIYSTPMTKVRVGNSMTFYNGFGDRNAVFERPTLRGQPPLKIGISMIPDGMTNTIFIVEGGIATEWTKPDALLWPQGGQRPMLGGHGPQLDFFNALTMDGGVRRIKRSISDATFRSLIGRAEGSFIQEDWEKR